MFTDHLRLRRARLLGAGFVTLLLVVGMASAQAGAPRPTRTAADLLASAAARAATPEQGRVLARRAERKIPHGLRRSARERLVGQALAIRVRRQQRCVTWTGAGSRVWPYSCEQVPAAAEPTRFGLYPGNVSDDPNAYQIDQTKTSSSLGPPAVVRVYFPGRPPRSFVGSKADIGLPVVVSFKARPEAITRGRDKAIVSFLRSVPPDRQVWWSYFHEPENDIEHRDFTARQYRDAWKRLLAVTPRRPNLHPTLILMRFDLSVPARRPLDRYVVPGLEVLAWDAYVGGECKAAAGCFAEAARASAHYGLGFAIAETSIVAGSPAAANRPAVVEDIVDSARAQNATFVTWFETNKADGDWRLSPYPDAASVWRSATH